MRSAYSLFVLLSQVRQVEAFAANPKYPNAKQKISKQTLCKESTIEIESIHEHRKRY
jgi:hypothetical protein